MDTEETTLLLPRFQPSALDSIPIYNIVLDIYDLISARVDTALKYDQLRSPQVHSFLIKPLVADLRDGLCAGTLYGLMANSIQFTKESSSYAAMAGVMATRAMICEIVAIKLLKDFDEDDLMNALTYDFYPLARGMPENSSTSQSTQSQLIPRWQRLSTLELAIKAEAKRFLAHPVVIQVLEEIWNGSIMFQTSMHKLHRVKFANEEEVLASQFGRRGAGIRYNYSDASILKLSRLRVPRYRHLLNLASFCVLLGLYLMVLSSHSMKISTQEIVFALWSLGFILDEIVGFTDVGFTLYILSLWNLFDLMILLQLIGYACCRINAIRLNATGQIDDAKKMLTLSYDILATVAIFLFPRLFSIFDNNESFSRMVIAVRKMSIDLAISWLVIVMLSSGFWIAFTLAFARNVFSSNQVAFDLMRILFGFTPVVWENWKYYSPIGRTILLFYLFITHFVVMTLLFAVLSNSFSEIVANSREEHQYLCAVNTISMIKSESSTLFSYSPPLNLIEWLVRPFFYILPLRQFLILNRTLVKITHFPVLYTIFIYERLYLRLVQIREKVKKDSQNQYRKKQEERLKALVTQLSSADDEIRSGSATPRKTRKKGKPVSTPVPVPGAVSHTEAVKKHQLMSKKISKYDLLDEVFKRPYKGTIKVRPKKPKIDLDVDINDSISRPQRNRDMSRLFHSRAGSSWTSTRPPGTEIYSDPEDTTARPYYESDAIDDEEWPGSYIPNTFERHLSGNSSIVRRLNDRTSPYLLPTVPSSTVLNKFHNEDNSAQNTRRRLPITSRGRLFSSTSSLFRQDSTMLGISPTRSTSSILRRANIHGAVRNRKWGPDHVSDHGKVKRSTNHDDEDNDDDDDYIVAKSDADVEDEPDQDDEDDRDDGEPTSLAAFNANPVDLWQMQEQIMNRIDSLEGLFKNIDKKLSQIASQN
ncbi:Yvc1p [Sugiyamaella lignohabitans]|uniref:Yvc1p n=1 Tax=Sugiyamaella lignohabitans TaxID=796027 RepID=A0A161HL81_9ASCO|nr:Yvc1p [Sugiyamaella lignohabitans]ANB13997.1 Yvc1p [Sugiyamaella lignohabitans]